MGYIGIYRDLAGSMGICKRVYGYIGIYRDL